MDSFLLTLVAIALAELGDKTQLVVIYLAARYRKPRAILAGILIGASANAGLAVAGGTVLYRLLPPGLLDWIVALGFVMIGLWILFGDSDTEEVPSGKLSSHGAFFTTLWLFFIMEMGDKTQLATVALAAGLPSTTWVFAGGALGLVVANLPSLWLGHTFAARLPHALLHRLSAGLFIVIGLGLMIHQLAQ